MDIPLLLADQLGLHLKSLRKLRGWSQADLGQRLGVGQARVAAIEANPGSISVDQLLRIFQVLEVELVARVRAEQGSPIPKTSLDPAAGTPAAAAPLTRQIVDLKRIIKSNKGEW